MDIIYIIIAIALVFLLFPYLGRKLYHLNQRKFFSIYLIGIGIMFTVNVAFSNTFDPSQSVEIISIYWERIVNIDLLFIFIVFFYTTGGLGLVGSLAELSSEWIEDVNLYSDLKKHTTPKAYIFYLIYGYIVIFSMYAPAKFLMILLGIEYNPAYAGIETLFNALQFESTFIVILGITLFSIKAFKLGYTSKDYWKTNLTYEERRATWYRYVRKFFVVFIYSWGVYIACILYFIEIFSLTPPFEYGGLEAMHLLFYLCGFIESIYFYTHKTELVAALKTEDEDYKKKEDESIIIEEEEPEEEKLPFDDDEIKFE